MLSKLLRSSRLVRMAVMMSVSPNMPNMMNKKAIIPPTAEPSRLGPICCAGSIDTT